MRITLERQLLIILRLFFEVVFWKLFSQPGRRQKSTNRIVGYVLEQKTQPKNLWDAVVKFIENKDIENLGKIREILGITTKVLAIPLTFPALACPEKFPMMDTQVAKWINEHYNTEHSTNMTNKLTKFNYNGKGVLIENDFKNYLNWVEWCREISVVLTQVTNNNWRARDVEMAVFTAQRNNLLLNPLPKISRT